MDQKPSVGRIVHYRALGSADGKFPVGECRAAIITAVPKDAELDKSSLEKSGGIYHDPVSLSVFNPTGMYFNQRAEYSEESKGGTWHWPERV